MPIKNTPEGSWRYRGWIVVLLAAACMVTTLPGRTVGLGLITEPLLADLQIAKTQYANLTFWATMIGATFSLACGPFIDRWGVRTALPAILLSVAATTVMMGYAVTAGSLLLFLILARGLGQSSLSTASTTAVGKWFTSHLGMALGVFSALVAVGFAMAIPIIGQALTTLPWRECWIGVGTAIAALGVLTFVLIPLNTGELASDQSDTMPSSTTWTDAIQTLAFWTFTVGTAFYYLVLSGLTLFNESVIAELGFDRSVFFIAMAAMMGAGLIGNFVYGWLVRKIDVPRLLSINLALLAIVLFSFPLLSTSNLVILHAALYGIVGGAFAVLFFTGYGQAFGQKHLGKIQGTAQVVGVVASALGPKLLAETEAITGSFLPAFKWLAPVAVVLAVFAWITRMPIPVTAQE